MKKFKLVVLLTIASFSGLFILPVKVTAADLNTEKESLFKKGILMKCNIWQIKKSFAYGELYRKLKKDEFKELINKLLTVSGFYNTITVDKINGFIEGKNDTEKNDIFKVLTDNADNTIQLQQNFNKYLEEFKNTLSDQDIASLKKEIQNRVLELDKILGNINSFIIQEEKTTGN